MNGSWLSQEISQIISSPHISFPNPAGFLPFRMGPGPVDLFSTKFNNTFAYDVKAFVVGKEVSREELKAKLLGLQKHWSAEQVKFQNGSAGPVCRHRCSRLHSLTALMQRSEAIAHFASGESISMSAEWVLSRLLSIFIRDLSVSRTEEEGGRRRIKRFSLDGDLSLFE